jgi:hypothetical protein
MNHPTRRRIARQDTLRGERQEVALASSALTEGVAGPVRFVFTR